MALVKDVYNLRFYNQLTDILQGVFPLFEKENFIKDIFSAGFDNMEYKERMRHTTQVLHSYMPDDYPKAVEIWLPIIVGHDTDYRQQYCSRELTW